MVFQAIRTSAVYSTACLEWKKKHIKAPHYWPFVKLSQNVVTRKPIAYSIMMRNDITNNIHLLPLVLVCRHIIDSFYSDVFAVNLFLGWLWTFLANVIPFPPIAYRSEY